jgi:hypothetical protein
MQQERYSTLNAVSEPIDFTNRQISLTGETWTRVVSRGLFCSEKQVFQLLVRNNQPMAGGFSDRHRRRHIDLRCETERK